MDKERIEQIIQDNSSDLAAENILELINEETKHLTEQLAEAESKLLKLKERKKSIELYNKK